MHCGFGAEMVFSVNAAASSTFSFDGLAHPGNIPPAHIVHLRSGSEPCSNHQWKARERKSPVFRSRCVFGVWSVHSGDWRDRAGDAIKMIPMQRALEGFGWHYYTTKLLKGSLCTCLSSIQCLCKINCEYIGTRYVLFRVVCSCALFRLREY